jgi:carboxyl-terminal processing protease
MQKLVDTAKKERYYERLGKELTDLENKLEAGKSNDLTNYKEEIMEILAEQIAFHYDLYDGQSQIFLKNDKAILAAAKVLKDTLTYNQLLSAN